MEINVRPARLKDIPSIKKLVALYAKQGRLLPRREAELKKAVRTFFVAEAEGEVRGCASLEVFSKKLAEVRSLAVAPAAHGAGVGRALVEACLKRARSRRVKEVMAISSAEGFFEKVGFSYALPHEKRAFFYWVQ